MIGVAIERFGKMDLKDRADIKKRFMDWLRQRVASLDVLMQEIGSCGLDTERREDLAFICHELSGTAGSFGFHEISDVARVVDEYIFDGGDDTDLLRGHVDRLRTVCMGVLLREI